jgi:hypothetical protein
VLGLVVLALVATRAFWIAGIGESLVCPQELVSSDVILIENFDPNYLLFERAAALEKTGVAPRALVPVESWRDSGAPNAVSRGVAEVMARQARLEAWAMVPIRESEPISLNAATQIREHLVRERIRSLIVVAPGFRSRRSWLVYRATLNRADISVRCVPVFGTTRPENWTETWHGIQDVALEFLKLQYYRAYVLPFRSGRWSPVGLI